MKPGKLNRSVDDLLSEPERKHLVTCGLIYVTIYAAGLFSGAIAFGLFLLR